MQLSKATKTRDLIIFQREDCFAAALSVHLCTVGDALRVIKPLHVAAVALACISSFASHRISLISAAHRVINLLQLHQI